MDRPMDRIDKRVLVIAAHPDDELLGCGGTIALHRRAGHPVTAVIACEGESLRYGPRGTGDRKSTRLNSSHTVISYAVFCLKKKKKKKTRNTTKNDSHICASHLTH